MAARLGARANEVMDDIVSNDPLEEDIETLPTKADIKAEKEARKRERQSGKSKGGIIAIIVFVLLLGVATAIIALDLFGLREQHIMPHVRNIPLIGTFFPAAEYVEGEDIRTPEQLRNITSAQDIQIASQERRIQDLQDQLDSANQAIANLRRFEEHHNEVSQALAEFSRVLAHGDPINFVEHFQHVSDEHVPQLLDEARALNAFEEGIMESVRTLNNMDESSAGDVLARYLVLQPDLLVEFLVRMSAVRRGEVFDTMEYATVATMIHMMTPQEPAFSQFVVPSLSPPPLVPPTVIPPAEEEEVYEEEYYDEDEAYEVETVTETEVEATETEEDEADDGEEAATE